MGSPKIYSHNTVSDINAGIKYHVTLEERLQIPLGYSAYATVLTNSAEWETGQNSVFATVSANSGNWYGTYSTVLANSAIWNETPSGGLTGCFVTCDEFNSVSGNWQNTYVNVLSNSGNWDGTYSTVLNNSGSWSTTTSGDLTGVFVPYFVLSPLTGNWESTYSTVLSNSANWDGAYSTVLNNSGDWSTTTSGDLTGAFVTRPEMSGYVDLTGNQSITGIKTFEPSTKFNSIIPASGEGIDIFSSGNLAYTPTTSSHILNKGYVDPLIEALSGDWSYGDSLELQYSPTNYSTSNNTLSAHLNAIDDSLNTSVSAIIDSPSGIVDSFSKSNRNSCIWDVDINNVLSGRLDQVFTHWNSNDDISYSTASTYSIPLTSSTDNVNLSVEINGNYVNLIAAVPNNDWVFKAKRKII